MIEKDLKLMEGAGYIWRVTLKNAAGEVLRADEYAVYGGFGAPWVHPHSYSVTEEDGVWVVRMHGVYACNGGRYQLMARSKATGVEWMLATGCVEVERRVGHCGCGSIEAEAGVVECVLHHETLEAEVVLGDSTAACVDACARVAAGVEEAKTANDAAWRAVERAESEAIKAENARYRAEKNELAAAELKAAADAYAVAAADSAADAEDAAAAASEDAAAAALAGQAVRENVAKVEARAADAAASAKAAADAASDALEAEAAARASEAAAARSAEVARGYDMRAFEYGQNAEEAAAAAESAAAAAAEAQAEAAAAQAEAEAQAQAAATSAAALYNPFAECTTWADVLRICPTINQCGHMSLVLPKMKGRVDGLLTNYELELDLTFPHQTWFVTTALLNIKAKHVRLYLPNMTGSNQSIMKHHNITHSASLIAPKMTDVSGTYRYDQTHGAVQMGHALSIYAPNATNASSAFFGQHRIGRITLYAPKCTNINSLFSPMMYNQYADAPRMSLTIGNVTHAESAFRYCKRVPDGDFPAEWAYLKYGNSMFSECELGRDLAVSVLNSLQTTTEETGTNIWCITVGIHIDHKTDEEVLAAIEAAEARGWTVAVQWNGTATASAASTYGMRRAGIYARRREAAEEGEQASLEWAHYVTNWEAHGYGEFGSVEEAAEFFGVELEPVAPEEE